MERNTLNKKGVTLNSQLINLQEVEKMSEIGNEIDMLEGNINRMCLTDDKKELDKMFKFAIMRVAEIYIFNLKMIIFKEMGRKVNEDKTY